MNLCRLCKEEHELRNSHIIPEFFYEPLYDEKHRFNILTTLENKSNSFSQKGIREFLLCNSCEQKIGNFEHYASLVFKSNLSGLSMHRDGPLIFVEGINYKKFKLFLLSIIWRASISSREFFKQVSLGPHEESLRLLLMNEEPGPALKYPCLIGGVTLGSGKPSDVIVEPRRVEIGAQTAYNMVIGNYSLLQFVSNQPPTGASPDIFLKENGSLVLMVRSATEVGPIKNFMQEFERLGRSPRL